MNIIIRSAKKEDCSRIYELVNELALFERAPDEVTVGLANFTESGFGNRPVWWAFVAEVDGVIEGFALFYIRFSTWKGERLYLEDLIVTEKMRGKGLGKRLFEEVVAEARKRKATGMQWQVLEWNVEAINFYKKFDAAFDSEWINCSLSF